MKILSSKIGKVAVLGALIASQMGGTLALASEEPAIKDVFVGVSCDATRTYPKYTSAIATVEGSTSDLPNFKEMVDARISRDFWDSNLKIEWIDLAKGTGNIGPDYVSAHFYKNTQHAKMGAYAFKFDIVRTIPAESNRQFYEMRPFLKDGRESGSVKCFEKVRLFELVDLIAKEMRGQ